MIHPILKQLPLSFNANEEISFDNFYAGRNSEVVQYLRKIVDTQLLENSYLCSTESTGRSHLLYATCRYANNQGISSIYIPLSQAISLKPDILTELESISLICIDDLQRIAGNRAWEEALFHLYNKTQQCKSRLLIAANGLPKEINLTLKDLESRLTWGVTFQLQGLEDQEKINVLMMRAQNRGMILPFDVAKYILTHCPRHMSTLMSALDVLDKTSLSAQRRLTIPFVKNVLQIN